MSKIYYTVTPNSQGDYTIKVYNIHADEPFLKHSFGLANLISVADDVIEEMGKADSACNVSEAIRL